LHENNITLSNYRLDNALEDYNTAIINYENGLYRATVNRAYYCIFHVMRSLLILYGNDYKKHSAVISEFRKKFIKTDIFDVGLSDIIADASDMRGSGDYDDMISISKEEAKQQIDNAKYFYDSVKPYIDNLIQESKIQ